MAKSKKGEYIPKKKVGRPTDYKPEYCETVVKLMDNGKSISGTCKELGISRMTFYRWVESREDFKEAVEKGVTYSEAWWEELGLAGMLGKIKGFNSAIYQHRVNRQFSWQNKDPKDHNTINIENLQITNESMDQLEDRIRQITSELKVLESTPKEVDESEC